MSESKDIKFTVNGKALTFHVNATVYDKYLNELAPTNKVAPARNFLLRTIASEDREALKTILELPGAGLRIAAEILEAYTPDLEIELGE